MYGLGRAGRVTTPTAGTGAPQRGKPGDLRLTLRLFRQFAGDRRTYWVGFALLVFEAGTSILEPIPIAFLIDFLQGAKPSLREYGAPAVLSSERFETILLLTLAIVLIATINSAADSLTEVCMARGGRSLGYRIRVAMYSHLQQLPLAYHDTKRTGDVLTRVTGDVLVVEDFVVKSVSNILGSLLVLVGSFIFLLTQSWSVALVAVVVIPMLALVSNYYSRRIKLASKTQRQREGELASTAQEMLTSIRLVQSYGRGTVDLDQFSRETKQSMRASLWAANIQAKFSFVISLVEALSIAAVVWLGVWLVDRDAITVGTLVLFVLLLQNMFKPARKIVSEWYKIGKVFASVERIDDLLDREIVVRDDPYAVPAPPLEGRLSFRHVGFTYPAEHEDGSRGNGRPAVLTDIDFELAPGEVVSLVGYSGAGKSTIAQLVPRLYDADHGEVLVDGLRVQDVTLASLRSQISLVLQDTVLLSGSVSENIGYGIPDATPSDIERAARLANAHEFIMALPDGYETHLGERGSTLSGGQRQRLAIARAFIRRAPILILDEPTTGLDAESARSVVDALRSLMRGKSTIVISHDLGLIRCADRVLVIADGRIVESGEHEQLIKLGGSYADLFTSHELHLEGADDERDLTAPSDADEAEPAEPPAARRPATLADPLHRQLPGLAKALDGEFAGKLVQGLLLDNDTVVSAATVGKVWLRADGSCSLRYGLQLADGYAALETDPVLARLHPDDEGAAAYLRNRVGRLPGLRVRTPPPAPWREPTALAAGAGLALHLFPFDPELPTLARASDPESVRRMLGGRRDDGLPQVDVVHHPREGACVLRYRFTNPTANGTTPATYYGKVYGDGTGSAVDRFLRALAMDQSASPTTSAARLPQPVVYFGSRRLLVTEALPGEPTLPRLLKHLFNGDSQPTSASHVAAARRATQAAGVALSALHDSRLDTAPVHTAADELARLHDELELVARLWPDVAQRVSRRIDVVAARLPESPAAKQVLSHGDFTPSQVLLDDDGLGVVDLDTLCRAEPALDLGRFLAHLQLRVARRAGSATTPVARELTEAFLRGYGESATGTAAGVGGQRVAFYTATTLARSALHACRALKADRLEIALDLLDSITVHDRKADL